MFFDNRLEEKEANKSCQEKIGKANCMLKNDHDFDGTYKPAKHTK